MGSLLCGHQKIAHLEQLPNVCLLGKLVIDFTPLLNNHPGGNKLLLQTLHKDITHHYYFHSVKSRKKIRSLKIGIIQ